MVTNVSYAQEQLWVGQTYQCYLEDYANRSLSWGNISWNVDNGLNTEYSGSNVRTVSFQQYKSGTYSVKVTWTETDMSDSYAPFYHKNHTWSFTCKDNPLLLSPSETNLTVGETQQLSSSFTYNNSYAKSVTYSSSNTTVATVSSSGLITAKAAGTATIKATSPSSKDAKTCTVKVIVPVTSITLNKTSLSLQVDKEETLTATVKPDNATDKSVTWSSSNTSVASVSNAGKVTAKATGSATITCQANDGSGKKATCAVTVSSPATSITLNKTSLSLQVGKQATLTATVKPDNAADKTVTWSSSNTNVATVSSSGVVKGVSAGTATITAKTSNNLSATCTITVTPVSPTNISLPASKTIAVGGTVTLSPTITPSNATTSLTWSSDDTSIATVTSSGKVKGINEGTARIRVNTSNGLSDWCDVTVKPNPTNIVISPTVVLEVGNTITLTPTITPSNALYTLTWSSTNTNIATVSTSGVVTGISAGTASIVAQTNNGLVATCDVSVFCPDPTGITLPSTIKLKVGESLTMNPILTPSNAATTFMWSSSDTSIATVNESGVIEGVGVGVTTINVETSNGLSASCEVTVNIQYDPNEVITFADPLVKVVCLACNWDTNGDGNISIGEAAAVTDLGTVFKGRTITSFDELRYFTGLTSIRAEAFSGCSNLASITIPESVTSIGADAFTGTKWFDSQPNDLVYAGKVAYKYKGTMPADTFIELKEGTQGIAANCFYNCEHLIYIFIPNSVTTIGDYAFYKCLDLISVKFPNNLTSIGDYAFNCCTNLRQLNIPQSVTYIGSKAFAGYRSYGSNPSYYNHLTEVSVNWETPLSIGSSVFDVCTCDTLFVPFGTKDLYMATTGWSTFQKIKEVKPKEYTLFDGQEYRYNSEIEVGTLHYSRTFKNTKWQAWYVPFDLLLTSEVLDRFAFAEFAGTYTEEDGSFYITVVRQKEGDVVKANTPYCVQAKVADSANPQVITQTDAMLKTAEENSFYVLSAEKKITFRGNYTRRAVTENDKNWYAMSGGQYSLQLPGNTIAPFRCFFTIEDREDNPYATTPTPAAVRLMMIDEETSIEELKNDEVSMKHERDLVYDLSGRIILKDRLPSGVYIINGKKVLVR